MLERVDLGRLIDETLDKMKFMSNFEKLDIEISVHDKIPFNSDHYRLSVMINNIISNAIKYQDISKPQPFLKIRVVVD